MVKEKTKKETINSLATSPREVDKISSIWITEEEKHSSKSKNPEKITSLKPLIKETVNTLWDEPKTKKRKTNKKINVPVNNIEPHKTVTPHQLTKHDANPIINPNKDNWWESEQVFNPGVVDIDGTVHMIYRSIGGDGMSRFGYAKTEDGFVIDHRLSYPVYKHEMTSNKGYYFVNPSGGSWGGGEDPRLVRVGDEDMIYMTYTAVDNGLRVGLSSIKINDFINRRWKWTKPKLISSPDQINKNWVIFPEKINGKYAILHSISPKLSIEYRENLNFKRNEFIESFYKNDESRSACWDSWVRGAGPPPLKTKYGWLIFYHAMNKFNPCQYMLGAMLTDLNEPEKILYRSKAPILSPDQTYENDGFKSGVVYASGAVIKNGNIIIYYGGADSYVCAAYTNLEQFLQHLMSEDANPKITIKSKKK